MIFQKPEAPVDSSLLCSIVAHARRRAPGSSCSLSWKFPVNYRWQSGNKKILSIQQEAVIIIKLKMIIIIIVIMVRENGPFSSERLFGVSPFSA